MTPGDIDSVNHVGIAVRNLDKAADRYQALGFILSPLSVHSGSKTPGEPPQLMATGNRCGFKAPTSFVLAARTGTWWTTACAPTGLTPPA
jgi:catechol 2,3-dioxygenase-like lactoylglutathione lyase family enzyme